MHDTYRVVYMTHLQTTTRSSGDVRLDSNGLLDIKLAASLRSELYIYMPLSKIQLDQIEEKQM